MKQAKLSLILDEASYMADHTRVRVWINKKTYVYRIMNGKIEKISRSSPSFKTAIEKGDDLEFAGRLYWKGDNNTFENRFGK